MKKSLLNSVCGVYLFAVSSLCFAGEPQVTVIAASAMNGYAMLAGKAKADMPGQVYVTIENGGAYYSTPVDPAGNWSVVIQLRSNSYKAKGWQGGQKLQWDAVASHSLEQ